MLTTPAKTPKIRVFPAQERERALSDELPDAIQLSSCAGKFSLPRHRSRPR